MELKVLSKQHIAFELRQSHALYTQNDGFYAIIGTEQFSFLIQPKCMFDSMNPYNLVIEKINAPTKMPTVDIGSKCQDLNDIYCKASIADKQTLIIDSLYSADFSLQPIEPIVNSICWPRRNDVHQNIQLVAIISSYGACEIRTKSDIVTDEWNSVVIDINDLWEKHLDVKYPPNVLKNMKDVQDFVNTNHITSCAWSDFNKETNCWLFFAANAAGTIITCELNHCEGKIIGTSKIDMEKVCRMKSIAFNTGDVSHRLIVVSNVDGEIKLLSHKDNKVSEVINLWSKSDKMRCQYFETYWCSVKNNLIIATTKGAHFVAFIIAFDQQLNSYKLISKKTHFVGNMAVTGLQMFKPYQYLVCAINGYTEHLHLNIENEEVEIIATPIKNDLESENYQILGIASTVNMAAWIFVMYPCRSFNAYLKKPMLITTCLFNVSDPLEILMNNKTLSMRDFADCTEAIRCIFLRNLETEKYLQFSTEPIQANYEFCYRVKILLAITNGKIVQCRKNSRYRTASLHETTLGHLRTIIETLNCYFKLDRLDKLNDLTETQKLSAKYMRHILVDFMCADFDESTIHTKEVLVPVFSDLCAKAENLDRTCLEKCQYCNGDVDLETKTCSEKHELQRCCITYLQVPLFSKRYCRQCKNLALDDENKLREVLFESEAICSFCDFPLIIDVTEDFTPIRI